MHAWEAFGDKQKNVDCRTGDNGLIGVEPAL